jgi:hypothetical protein
MAGSFSQQIAEKNGQQEQSRISRTQRKQAEQQEAVAKYKFESAKAEAERLRTQEFIEKDVVRKEQYNIYRPKSISARDWDRMSSDAQARAMKDYYKGYGIDYYIRKGYVVVHATGTRDVTEKDPFTFEEYKQEYAKLSPDVQQFFASPESITAEEQRLKDVEKTSVTTTLSNWQTKLTERQQKITEYQQWWSNKPSKYRKDPSNRESFDRRMRDYEWDVEEYEDKIRYLQQEQGKVDQGYKSNDLINYAEDKADYNRQRHEGNYNAQQSYLQQLNQGQLDADLVKLGFAQGEKPKYQDFIKSVEKFNKDVAYTNQLKNWAGKVGFEKLPSYAQEKLNPQAMEWQKKYPNEKLVFDKSGNVVGVSSGAFQQSMNIDAYNKKLSSIKTPDELKIEAKNYLTDFSTKVSSTSLNAPEKSFWGKAGEYLSAIKLASPFGTDVSLSETKQRELTALREQRVREAFKPEINLASPFPVQLPAYKFSTLPFQTSLEAIKEEGSAKYRAEQKAKLFEDLNKQVENAPDELKYYVQEQGLEILKGKGLQYQVKPTNQMKFENGKFTGIENVGDQIVVTDPDFERKISQNMLEWEKERNKKGALGEILLGTRIVSTKAVEFYGLTKAIGFGFGKVVQGGKWIYGSLGGGMKIADLSVRGGSLTATVVPTTTSTVTKVALATGKYGFIAGVTGLYGFEKYKQYGSYKASSQFGGEVFALETAGELTGLGLSIGEDIYSKYQTKKINERIAKENSLLEQKRTGIKNIKDYGQFSDKASLKYDQAGIGKPVKLSNDQLRVVAQDYARVSGISEKEAMQILRERSFYKTTLSVRGSTVPSTERTLKYLRTGKATSGDDVYRVARYGFTDQVRTAKGVKEVAFEFNLRGSKISNLQLKTTVVEDQSALTSVFEKARFSKKTPDKILRLRETILTKVTKAQEKNIGEAKISLTETENRLLNTYPYGKDRLDLKEVLRIGLQQDQLKNFEKMWAKSGSVGKTSAFKNLRIESPLYTGNANLKIALEGEYKFFQTGRGKRSLALKNIIYDLEQAGYFKEIARSGKISKPIYDQQLINEIAGKSSTQTGIGSAGSDNILKETIKSKAVLQNVQISPTINTFKIRTRTSLKETIKSLDSLSTDLASGLITEQAILQQTKQKQNLKQDLQQKSAQQQIERLMQDLSVRQVQQQKFKETSVSDAILQLTTPKFQIPNLLTPIIPETTIRRTAKIGGFDFEKDILKEKIKKRGKVKDIEFFALLPDFTSRAIGISPKQLSVKDAIKEMRKIQTGFEVRTGGRIKGYSPIDEKSLLKGIMQ